MANSAFTHDPSFTIPGSTTDNAVIRWDGTSGAGQQNSGILIDDSNVITGITSLTVDNLNINGNTIISTDTNGNITFAPHGSGSVIADTVGNSEMSFNGTVLDLKNNGTQSSIKLYCETGNAHYQEIRGGPHSGATSYTMVLPHVPPTANQVLTTASISSNVAVLDWADAAGGGVDTTGTPADNQIAIFTDADTLEGRAELTHDGTNLLTKNTTGNNSYIIISHSGTVGGYQSGVYFKTNTTTNVKLDVTGDGHMTWRQGASETVAMALKASQGGLIIGSGVDVDTIKGTLHVKNASAGSYNVYGGGDDFIIESSGNTGMTIAAPDSATNFFCLATPSGGTQASGFYMSYNSGAEYFAIMNAGGEKWKVTDGGVVSGQHGTYHQSSDVRIKENVTAITYGLDAVMAMRPISYEFCDWYDANLANQTRLGFIAQEVKEIAPETVNIATTPVVFEYKADDDTPVVETHETIEDMHSIEEQQIIPILVKAIQELKAEIDLLKG